MKIVRMSWFHDNRDEPHSKHLQEVCEDSLVNTVLEKMSHSAWLQGIRIPARQTTVNDWPEKTE